jgi:hypothetical protein
MADASDPKLKPGRSPRRQKKATDDLRLERQFFVCNLRFHEKLSYIEIAERYQQTYNETIAVSTIGEWIREHRKRYLAEIDGMLDVEREEHRAILDYALSEAVKGWRNSLQPTKKKSVIVENGIEPKTGNAYDKQIIGDEETSNAGDPRFLKVMIEALNRHAKLTGIDPAPKSAQRVDAPEANPDKMPWAIMAAALQDKFEALDDDDRRLILGEVEDTGDAT